MVEAMRATSLGQGEGWRRGGVDLIREVTAASPGYQGKGPCVVVPESEFCAKAAQLDHRKRKVEMVVLAFARWFIELKGRHVLRCSGRDKPAVVADGYKYANFHLRTLFTTIRR